MDTLQTLAALMHLFEELHTVAKKRTEWLPGWFSPPWQAVWLDPDAQLEGEAQVRKLEQELTLEKDLWCPLLS